MAGYVASARIEGRAPRFAGWAAAGWQAAPDTASAEPWPGESGPIDIVGRPLDECLDNWLASVGESWSQLTFFLFDPQSWR